MKKISSVFITALVFVVGFMTSTFAGTKTQSDKTTRLNKEKKKLTSGETKNIEKTSGTTSLEEGKLTDLQKAEDAQKTSLETIKLEDLDATNVKLNDLELKSNTGLDIKIDDLETKR